MFANRVNCGQCGTAHTVGNRIITDSCGHHKCRNCFLGEALHCKQCNEDSTQSCGLQTEDSNGGKKTPNEGKKTPKKRQKTELSKGTHIQENILSTGERQYRCTVCDRIFHSRTQQYYHLGCNNSDGKKYKCDHCQKCFSTRAHLRYHVESHSSEEHHCSQCGKRFSNRIVLRKHERLHQLKPIACTRCDKTFRGKDALAAHVASKHTNDLRHDCSVCGRKYASKSALKQHLLKHQSRKHACHKCGKSFQRHSTLKLHSKRHLKADSFVCAICLKKYSDAGALKRHYKKHEDTTKYRCVHCDITTVRKDNMLRHVRNMHVDHVFDQCVEMLKPTQYVAEEEKKRKENEEANNFELFIFPMVTSADTIQLPKTVKNSSVIKCIGNVKPVKVPNVGEVKVGNIENKGCPYNLAALKVLELNNTHSTDAVAVNPSLQNDDDSKTEEENSKKQYNPIEMYRRILEDDISEEQKIENTENPEVPVPVIQNDSTEGSTAPQQEEKRTTLHWRKTFKYNYELAEY